MEGHQDTETAIDATGGAGSSLDPSHRAFAEGVRCHQDKDFDGAIAYYREAIDLDPEFGPAFLNLGAALRASGQMEDGLKALERAVELSPDSPDAHFNLGNALRDTGKFTEAIDQFRHALGLQRNHFGAAKNLGKVLAERGDLETASEVLGVAVRLHPGSADLFNELGLVLFAQRHIEASISWFRKALDHQPNLVTAQANLGIALNAMGDHHQAEIVFQGALALEPDSSSARIGMGQTLASLGRCEEALTHFDDVLARDSENLDARFGRARTYFLMGRLLEGWEDYELRWQAPKIRRPDHPGPTWDGSSFDGKTVLLYADQGFGDVLQFVRYAPMVAARGGRVVILCQETLVPVIETVEGIEAVCSAVGDLPHFDTHCALMDLPRIFKTTLETIPAKAPYISWPRRSQGKGKNGDSDPETKRVGLVWAGNPKHSNDRNRSCSLQDLWPLLAMPNTTIYSLQVGPAVREIQDLGLSTLIVDAGSRFKTFADTADIVAQLDLVISVDTAVAHLAGALGKPVWVLLPFVPDWRWLLERNDTPWYPTMCLFRQTRPHDWEPVVGRLIEAFRKEQCHAPEIGFSVV